VLTDAGAVAGLVLVCLLAWCAANSKWTVEAWSLPTAYVNDPEKADFIANACSVKAARSWWHLPIFWKTVPELGAPFTGDWNDIPTLDELVLGWQAALAAVFGLFGGINLSFALAHVFAAVAMYVAARYSGADRLWAWIAAAAFGLSPFIFAQSPHHMQVAYVWPVALFPIVWRWVATDPGTPLGTPQWRWAALIAVVTGLHFVYYTNVFCQLTLLGAGVAYLRNRDAKAFRGAVALVAIAVLTTACMNIDTWTYQWVHGRAGQGIIREYKWLEIYGLKLVDLTIPPLTHRSDLFASFALRHRQGAPLLDEGASYLGLLGLLSLAGLCISTGRALLAQKLQEVPLEAWQVLWIILMFTTGGLNAIGGAYGFTLFRAACRYSVVILAIVLLYTAREMSRASRSIAARVGGEGRLILTGTVLVGATALVFWDQVPRTPPRESLEMIANLVRNDRDFVAKMEAALSPGSMVFQLPIMEFPEAPHPGVSAYDHFRPYLYSHGLRYSFGSSRGRESSAWLQQLSQKQPKDAIAEIKRRGFAAIYINRNGFPDRAKGIEDALLEMGYAKPPIRSASGDLACILLDEK
jgi:phosphoglycerol transferase